MLSVAIDERQGRRVRKAAVRRWPIARDGAANGSQEPDAGAFSG